MIKSIYENQSELLRGLLSLHCNDNIVADITYGNGGLYKDFGWEPSYRFDIDPQCEGIVKACSTTLPIANETFTSVMFDPPFLTYVKNARNHADGKHIMASRFGGYYTYEELKKHYQDTLDECHRVLCRKGVLVFKCQDIIHNHKMHCTHVNVIRWAEDRGFRLKDLFILVAKNRMPIPPTKTQTVPKKQKHARIFHSYFLVFEKL